MRSSRFVTAGLPADPRQDEEHGNREKSHVHRRAGESQGHLEEPEGEENHHEDGKHAADADGARVGHGTDRNWNGGQSTAMFRATPPERVIGCRDSILSTGQQNQPEAARERLLSSIQE